jgi:hypothetical protein
MLSAFRDWFPPLMATSVMIAASNIYNQQPRTVQIELRQLRSSLSNSSSKSLLAIPATCHHQPDIQRLASVPLFMNPVNEFAVPLKFLPYLKYL